METEKEKGAADEPKRKKQKKESKGEAEPNGSSKASGTTRTTSASSAAAARSAAAATTSVPSSVATALPAPTTTSAAAPAAKANKATGNNKTTGKRGKADADSVAIPVQQPLSEPATSMAVSRILMTNAAYQHKGQFVRTIQLALLSFSCSLVLTYAVAAFFLQSLGLYLRHVDIAFHDHALLDNRPCAARPGDRACQQIYPEVR